MSEQDTNFQSQRAGDPVAEACGSVFDATSWLCVQTLPQSESLARLHLERQAWTVYFPRIWKKRPGRRGQFDWLFPRYGFVAVNLATQSWSSIQHTLGVSSLVMQAKNVPAIVSPIEIERIRRARLDRVRLDAVAPVQDFTGKHFSVLDGPLHALGPAVCTWHTRDRIKLLHTLFGRETEVEYALAQVKLVDDGGQSTANGEGARASRGTG